MGSCTDPIGLTLLQRLRAMSRYEGDDPGLGDEAAAEIERLQAPNCAWAEDDDGNWWTGCANAFCLEAGTPRDNGMCYCCYCGGKLIEAAL